MFNENEVVEHILNLIETKKERVVINRIDLTEIEFKKEQSYKRKGFVKVVDGFKYQMVASIDIVADSQYYSNPDGKHHMRYCDSNGVKGLITVSKNPLVYFSKVNRLYRTLMNLRSNCRYERKKV